MPHDIASFQHHTLAQTILRVPCPQKILMVTDGPLNFGTNFFGLSEFVGIITAAGHTVSTAHRSGSGPTTIPGAFDFSTAATPVTLANYDQLWLFGFDNNSNALSATEQTVIAQFMQAGGGIFATGDHEDLGQGMGGNIPRVRRMRDWSSIPMTDPDRHDTVIHPGIDGIKQFDDQADRFPQQIYPVFFSNGGPDDSPSTWSVHPVLRHPSGAVDFLPDHAHESECLEPVPDAVVFDGNDEWPVPASGGARIQAYVVAVSVSAGRFITDALKPPVRPRCFGAISAYDGDPANVGRIVCDATWHHFVNINLNGAGGVPDTTGAPREGLYLGGVPTPEYQKIKTYYGNTARWLAPKGRRSCWPWIITALVRFDHEVLELNLPEPHPCPWDRLMRIGLVAEEALRRYWGPGALADVVEDLLAATDAAPELGRVLKAQQFTREERARPAEPALPAANDVRRAVFASLVNLLAQELPPDEKKLGSLLKKGHDDLAARHIGEAVRAAAPEIAMHLERVAARTTSLTSMFRSMRS